MNDIQLRKKWIKEVMEPAEKKPGLYDTGEEYHWESMAYGFFLALGVEPRRAQNLASRVPK